MVTFVFDDGYKAEDVFEELAREWTATRESSASSKAPARSASGHSGW